MDTKFLERVQAILKEEGFTHIEKHSSTHSATLSADKGAERVVMHITDQEELPYQAARNEEFPSASEIRVSASLPGLRPDAAGQVKQRTGQGGALRKMERVKRHQS